MSTSSRCEGSIPDKCLAVTSRDLGYTGSMPTPFEGSTALGAAGRPATSAPRWRRVLGSRALHLIVLIFGGGWLILAALEAAGGPDAIRERHGLMAVAFLIPAQIAAALTPVPSELIAIPTAAIYEFWLGALVIWFGWVAATPFRYLVVRHLARDLNLEGGREKLPRWLQRFPVESPVYLVCARWLPYGPHLVDYTAGAAGVRLRTLLWSAAIATIAPALLFSALANELLG